MTPENRRYIPEHLRPGPDTYRDFVIRRTAPLRKKEKPLSERQAEVLEILTTYAEEKPDTSVSLAWLGRQLHVTTTRAVQLYEVLEMKGYRLPTRAVSGEKKPEVLAMDQQIRNLISENMSLQEIRETLKISGSRLYLARKRLKAAGKLKEAKKPVNPYATLDWKIKELRDNKLGNKAIVKTLGESDSLIKQRLKFLVAEGKTKALRNRKTLPELKKLDEKVKELAVEGLKAREIAKRLEETKPTVLSSIRRLKKRGELPLA